MLINGFEDVVAWQKAKTLTLNIYKIFEKTTDYGLKNQIQRAAVSIMNNIAEGFERQTKNELKQFLYISKGSCAEVKSMLYLSLELNILSEKDFKENHDLTVEIIRLLSAFIKSIK